jgi:GH15 family glucan-1,4-alpha-glucosidase
MAGAIEDYALIGDRETAALVSRDGSIDWLCLPRFDSPACFAALLGDEGNGRWKLHPSGEVVRTRRTYRSGTMVLETEYETTGGVVCVIDCMPARERLPRLLRVVEGRLGSVAMDLELVFRFDYGAIVPWVRKTPSGVLAVAGPDAVHVQSDVPLVGRGFRTHAHFVVGDGERVSFALSWHCTFEDASSERVDVPAAVRRTTSWWRRWSSRATYDGPHHDAVERSLLTLKALTYAPSGAIVAAPTTSLPERWQGQLNWDYRYCWVRDATFTLYAMMNAGYSHEATRWRDWLLSVVAGKGEQVRAMYSVLGERRLTEVEVPWLAGFHGAKPVRIGNAANDQLQLDIVGELADMLFLSARIDLDGHDIGWPLHRELVEFLEGAWRQPDSGMWEVRGTRREFVHSKVMAWVAFDRSVKLMESLKLDGPLDRWRKVRATIHDEVCRKGYDAEKRSFVQYYGAREVDASSLLIPLVGFLPISDERVAGTVRAIEHDLLLEGFLRRYCATDCDGRTRSEGCFLPCSFWLADVYLLADRRREAEALFGRVVAVANDVGLLAEEYDPTTRRMLGNFPQAFSHVALVNSAHNLSQAVGPARHRLEAKAPEARGRRRRRTRRRQ